MTIKKSRKKPPRTPLSQDRIVTAALGLIDKIGIEEFSTRKLGAELGCEAMAIYNHFDSKDTLLDAVTDRMIAKVDVPTAGPGWQERVRGFSRSYRALAKLHPRAFPLLATRRFAGPAGLSVLERTFTALIDEEGFEPLLASRLFRTVGNFTSGTALDEIAGALDAASHGPQSDAEAAALASAYPRLAKVTRHLAPAQFDAVFEHGLEVILDGFAREKDRAR